jgi:uncharacterized RDD family membrane protein YckC
MASHPSHQQSGGFGRRGLANAPNHGAQSSAPWGEQRHSLDKAMAPSRSAVWDDIAHQRENGRSGAATNLGPAGFWIRFLAYVVDGLILMVLVMTLSFIAMALGAVPMTEILYIVINTIVAVTYITLFHSGGWQATPGKRLLGVYVVSNEGRPLSIPHALGRYLAVAVSVVTLGIGFLMAGWNRDKKALHDYVAGTRAVRGRVD